MGFLPAYVRSLDGAVMVEIAPDQFINADAAIALGFVARHQVPPANSLEG